MFVRWKRWQQGLTVQIVTTMIGLVFLTAFAIGIPVLWISQTQLERQAWTLVNQVNQTTHILIETKQKDLTNLAILAAQRPALNRLVEQNDQIGLDRYLAELQTRLELDLLVICGPQERTSDLELSRAVCRHPGIEGFFLEESGVSPRGWFLSSYPLSKEAEGFWGVVGVEVDDQFTRQLQTIAGMELVLLFNDQYGASSFQNGLTTWEGIDPALGVDPAQSLTFEAGGIHYFAIRSAFGGTDLEVLTALALTDMMIARQQLHWVVGAGVLGVILLSSSLGMVRARRISRPLNRLQEAAGELRKGELSKPVKIDTQIKELAQLSYALDDARIALNHILAGLRKEKAWSEHILESVVEGIITIDRWGRITFFSKGAEAITGWNQDEVLGQFIDSIIKLSEGDGSFSQYIPAPGGKQKMLVRLKNGNPATLDISGAKLVPPEADQADFALVLRDVSNEEAIRRLLGDFLANVTHEFRTPLSGLEASIELLLEQLPDLEQHEIEELLNNIHLGILSLQQLIDNLLEGASIEAGKFQVRIQPTSAIEIAEEAIRIVQPLVDKYGLVVGKVWPDGLPQVRADPRRTIQVIVNLLSNAVKWSKEHTEIIVSITTHQNFVEIMVSDDGPGILPEDQKTLFHRFGKGQAGNRAGHGAGLGLSVVKAIVEAQGGQVGVRNRAHGGAEFWFTIPILKTSGKHEEGDG